MNTPVTQQDQQDIALAMMKYGGSFVQALGKAYSRADSINASKIELAFPEHIELYASKAEYDRQIEAEKRKAQGAGSETA